MPRDEKYRIHCLKGFIRKIPFQPVIEKKAFPTAKCDSNTPQKNLSSLHLLLVEDNRTNRELAVMMLEQDGHRVTTAENGLEALKILADHHFDAILMDVQMPVMDGLTCSRMIRSLERNDAPEIELSAELQTGLEKRLSGRSITIVAMTAHAMSGDSERCLQAGMDCYLTKPFEPEKVTAARRQPSCQGQNSSADKIQFCTRTARPDSDNLGKKL